MGHMLTDGKAENFVAPDATEILHGDLYRIDGLNGFALVGDGRADSKILAADTDRGFAMEIDTNRIWKVKIPAAINPARGTLLYWTTGAGFKRGDTHLVTAAGVAGEPPCALVIRAKNAAGYAAVRVLNGATGDAT